MLIKPPRFDDCAVVITAAKVRVKLVVKVAVKVAVKVPAKPTV